MWFVGGRTGDFVGFAETLVIGVFVGASVLCLAGAGLGANCDTGVSVFLFVGFVVGGLTGRVTGAVTVGGLTTFVGAVVGLRETGDREENGVPGA